VLEAAVEAEGSSSEDTSDEAFERLHAPLLEEERIRLNPVGRCLSLWGVLKVQGGWFPWRGLHCWLLQARGTVLLYSIDTSIPRAQGCFQ
jgi:hypothetical protein